MTDFNIIERDDGLVVRATRVPSLGDGVLSAAAAGVFVGIAASFLAGRPQAIALALLTAAAAYVYARRTRPFELRMTRFEFVAVGKVGDNLGNKRSRPRSNGLNIRRIRLGRRRLIIPADCTLS
jgi:hypothetical protein